MDQPITPSPIRGKGKGQAEDLLSATFADFLISAEEDPVPYIGGSPSTIITKDGFTRTEINFPLPPFRLGSELPSTPSPRIRSNPLEPPGAPARSRQSTTIPPPSSSALQRAMGLKLAPSSPLGRSLSAETRDLVTIRPRHAVPSTCSALQLATGLAPTPEQRPTKPSSSSSSTCSSSTSASSFSMKSRSQSRSALPTRSPLPKDWIGYHPKETRI
jgi:hypothetical protein